jgi:hypothetical protein
MGTIKKGLNKFLWKNNKIFKFPIAIQDWFGRLGNNIQQISLAIMYAKINGFKLTTPDHPNIRSISFGTSRFWWRKYKIKNRFFFFSEVDETSRDIKMSYKYVCENIQKIAQEFITPNFKFQIAEPLGENVLVVHLRGGDIYQKDEYTNNKYVQNPLSFYENLILNFDKTILVCEPGDENPVVSVLKKYPSVIIQSSSVQEDFSTILRAKNLATSGVGTFAIAAALCSKNLEILFCTDRYLTEHLNPEMIKNAKVHCLKLGNEYIKIGSWGADEKNISEMLSYQVDKNYFKKIFPKYESAIPSDTQK